MKKMVDPPSGWKYGFPKELPKGVENFNEWLVSEGYPQKEIDYWKGAVPCGMWMEE